MSYSLGELPNNLQCLQCWIWRSQAAIHLKVNDSCNWVDDVVEPSYCHWCDKPFNLNGNATVEWVHHGDESGYDPYDVGCDVDGMSEYACGGSPSGNAPVPTVDEWLRFLFIIVAIVGIIILLLTVLFFMVCGTTQPRTLSGGLSDRFIVNDEQIDDDSRIMRSPSLGGGAYSEHTMADYYRGLDAVDDNLSIKYEEEYDENELDYSIEYPSSIRPPTPDSLINNQHAIN